jgi:pimeloyl-ACP methyl ester carboxylesterase
VDRLVLVDPSGFPGAPADPLVFRLARLPLLGHLVAWIDPSPFVRRSMREVYADPDRLTDARLHRYRALALAPGNRRAFVDRVRTAPDWPFERTRDVRVPVLIQWGEQDTWTPFSNAVPYSDAFSDSRLISYPDAGHVPMEENPAQTARDAKGFLLEP